MVQKLESYGEESLLKTKTCVCLTFMLLFMSVAVSLKFPVKGDPNSIYIRPDGSIDPPGTPIQCVGDQYTFMNNISGFIFVQKDNIFIDGNNCWVQGNGAGYGFELTGRNNVTIINCTITGFLSGIHLYFSSNMSLINNRIELNVGTGLQIISSNGGCVVNNNFTSNGGIAVLLSWSLGINVSGNFVTANYAGIMLDASSVTMRNNNISGNNYNFGVDGKQLSHFINDIDTSNTINNNPIYYLVNKRDMDVPSDAGYVAVINSTNMTVKNLTLTNNDNGILLYSASNSTIQNVSTLYNDCGIALIESSNNNITSCSTETSYFGIRLKDSSNNNITNCKIANNRYGIRLIRASGNKIFHNNFFSYGQQVNTDSESVNIWNDSYPDGGNYWSDYDDIDLYSGPYQNITGSDGIGDSPYSINIGNKDNYPLMEPWTPPKDNEPPTIETPSRTPSGDVPLNQEVTVTVNVTDTESEVKNVTLSYKLGNATSWTDLLMNYNETSHLYEIIIPGQPNQTSVSFKITAFDNAENMATKDNAGEYYVYSVVPEHFTLIALLLFMIVSALIITRTKRNQETKKHRAYTPENCKRTL
jgi:parallel beta-helix repeat protein